MFSGLRVPHCIDIYGKHFPKYLVSEETIVHKNNCLKLMNLDLAHF